MGWNTVGPDLTSSFVYCTSCKTYTSFPHECPNDPIKEILRRLERIERLLEQGSSSLSTSPSDSQA